MIDIKPSLAAFAIFLAAALPAVPAQAQLARTFVSGAVGNDANDCNLSTPCRTFQSAHDKTLANGEITVLDPGGYGAVTITKSISIINDGVGEAGVLVSGGLNGITISATAGVDSVSLRGLTIKGIGFGGGSGIRFNSAKSLTVENCAIRSLTGAHPSGYGIYFAPTTSTSLAVSSTLVADNFNTGVFVTPLGPGLVKTTFSRLETYNNGNMGLWATGINGTATIHATVADSIASNNGFNGFYANTIGGAGVVNLMVVRSVAANNAQSGVSSTGGAGATLRLGQSTVTGNAISWTASGGATLVSYGDNNIDGNGDGDPAPPTIVKK